MRMVGTGPASHSSPASAMASPLARHPLATQAAALSWSLGMHARKSSALALGDRTANSGARSRSARSAPCSLASSVGVPLWAAWLMGREDMGFSSS